MIKKNSAELVIYIIWAFIFFIMIYDLFQSPARSIFWLIELSLSVLIYYKLKIPAWTYFLILLLCLANIFGEHFLGLFYTVVNYDKLLHLFSPLVGCVFFYIIFEKYIPNRKILILFSVALVFSWSLTWEVIEYFFDLYFDMRTTGVHIRVFNGKEFTQYMTPLQDIVYDMLFTIIGSLIFAAGALLNIKWKEKIEKSAG